MEASIHIARMIGPLLILNGIAILAGGKAYRETAQEFLNSRALIYLAGFITLVLGLGIVNAWQPGWPIAVTAIGWLFVIGGAFRMLLPGRAAEMGKAMLEKSPWIMPVAGMAHLVMGLALTKAGQLF